MRKNNKSMIYDIVIMCFGCAVIFMTLITFLQLEHNYILLPYVFAVGSVWLALITGKCITEKRKVTAAICGVVILTLLFLSIKGFVDYWG